VLENLAPGIGVAVLAGAMNFATARIMLRVAQQHDSITIEADAKHLLTDVWTSVGVVAGLIVVMVNPAWWWLDPLVALAVGINIVFTGVRLLRRSVDGLMDASLPASEIARIERALRAELPEGATFHALRTRKAGMRRFVELHLVVPGSTLVAESHAWCDRIEAAIERELSNTTVSIHVEPTGMEEEPRAARVDA
jgi:cation diffusion facilitator family transporter